MRASSHSWVLCGLLFFVVLGLDELRFSSNNATSPVMVLVVFVCSLCLVKRGVQAAATSLSMVNLMDLRVICFNLTRIYVPLLLKVGINLNCNKCADFVVL